MRRTALRSVALAALVLSCVAVGPVGAQSLREAVLIGTRRDPSIASLRQQVAAETSNVEIAKDARRPQFSLSGDTGYDDDDLGLNLTVTQLLADWGLSKSEIASAEARRVKVVAELKSEVEDFTLSMAQLYFELDMARLKIDRTVDYVAFANRLERYSRERVGAGLANSSEVARARLEISRAEEELYQLRSDRDIAAAEAEFLLGQKLANISAPPNLGFRERLQSNSQVIGAVVGAPSYVAASADVSIAQASVRAAKASRLPKLQLQATVRQDLTGGRSRSSSAGLSAGVDLTSSSFRGRAVIAADQRLKAAQQALRAVERDLQNDARTYRQKLEALSVSAASLKGQVADSKVVLQSFEEQFRIGRRDLLDLLSTGRDLYEAEISEIDLNDEMKQTEYKAAHSVGLLGSLLLGAGHGKRG
ncbi:TolC family protein [Pseudodonghicola xiamenensis]|uniref:TolC family protein n=1 Tax=Pseudodonghicola xiamenensis TaxID=337702 RepID=UPI0012B645F1|nr:TolC family protein [Pseudodonghicola xiamenensis]